VLAREDSVAPSAPTLARLDALRREGKPIDIAIFPDADHGIRRFTARADGSRAPLAGYAEGYLQLLADWMRGLTRSVYGRAVLAGGR
jgi:dipeptidyl aminopeptidase/acylaminoacyl peptidase